MVAPNPSPAAPTHPIPAGPPIRAWNTIRVLRDPYCWLSTWRAAYGDTYLLRAMNGDVVVSCDPDVLRDLLRADSFQVRPFAVEATLPIVGQGSVFNLSGEAHRAERKLLGPPFHGERMRAYGDVMLRSVDEASNAWTNGTKIVASDVMLGVSLRVIVRAVFGVLEDADVERWVRAIWGFIGDLHPLVLFFPRLQLAPFGWGPWGRFVTARAAFQELLRGELRSRRASGKRGPDILSMLLDSHRPDGTPASEDDVVDELVTLLFAGHETTQLLMAWMLYRIARDPRVEAKLVAELDATDGSPEALAKAPYLDAVTSETLRLDPIVPDVIRTLAVPMRLGRYELAAGAHVALAAGLIHTREELYPEPALFRPERFLERAFKPHEFLPFGGGVRRCLGAELATWEAKVVVGTLLRRFRFTSLSEEVAVRRNVTMGPATGVHLSVTRR